MGNNTEYKSHLMRSYTYILLYGEGISEYIAKIEDIKLMLYQSCVI